MQPHSSAWYRRLAQTRGGYFYPWNQTLEAPGGEQLFDALLESLLTPLTRVLEAGCAEGKDAARFGPSAASWTGYDFVPEFLEQAGQNVPSAEFVYWHSGKEPPPEQLLGRFDLIVSRRGPTSLVDHLPRLSRPAASVLCVHPWDEEAVRKVREKLAGIGLEPSAEWFVSAKGYLPEFSDLLAYRRWHGDERDELELRQEWEAKASDRGLPMLERRYVWLAKLG